MPPIAMADWIYFIHPPRENFAETMTDEEAARKLMHEDPVIAGGFARGERRPFRVSMMRGRDR